MKRETLHIVITLVIIGLLSSFGFAFAQSAQFDGYGGVHRDRQDRQVRRDRQERRMSWPRPSIATQTDPLTILALALPTDESGGNGEVEVEEDPPEVVEDPDPRRPERRAWHLRMWDLVRGR
jgi:hypothetical protein